MTAESDEEYGRRRWEETIAAAQSGDVDALAIVYQHGDWHQKRRTGIGGSDVAAVLGLDDDRRPIDVYLEKIGERAPWEGDERTRMGKKLEPLIAAEYQARHEHEGILVGPFEPRRRRDRPWHIYTLDRLLLSPMIARGGTHIERVVEIKSHGFRRRTAYGHEGTDEAPESVLCQVAWYVAAVECSGGGVVAALFDTHEYREFPVPRHEDVEARMLEEVERWWRAHVVARVPPEPDGSESFARYLRERFSVTSADQSYIHPTPEMREQLDRLRVVNWLAKQIEVEEKRLKQALALAVGDAAGLELPEGRLHCKPRKGNPDIGAIVALLAERLGLDGKALDELREQHRHPASRPMLLPAGWRDDLKSYRLDLTELLPRAAQLMNPTKEPNR